MRLPQDEYLAVEPLAAEESILLHTCAAGHRWKEQPDGAVSPSWGYAGTHASFPGHDPTTCPEPERDGEGRYECPGCGGRFFSGHGERGVMCDPWNYQEGCTPPPPVCRKPAVGTARWMRVKKMLPVQRDGAGPCAYEPGWTRSWVSLDESGAPAPEHVREPTLF
jgi:hypothetical protein